MRFPLRLFVVYVHRPQNFIDVGYVRMQLNERNGREAREVGADTIYGSYLSEPVKMKCMCTHTHIWALSSLIHRMK